MQILPHLARHRPILAPIWQAIGQHLGFVGQTSADIGGLSKFRSRSGHIPCLGTNLPDLCASPVGGGGGTLAVCFVCFGAGPNPVSQAYLSCTCRFSSVSGALPSRRNRKGSGGPRVAHLLRALCPDGSAAGAACHECLSGRTGAQVRRS